MPDKVFSIFHCSVLVRPQVPVFIWQEWNAVWPCAAVDYLHKVHSEILFCSNNHWLFEFLLPSNQLKAVWSFSSDLWYQAANLCKPCRWLDGKIPDLRPARTAPTTIPCSKLLKSLFLLILTLSLNFSRLSWPCLYAQMHWVAATWLDEPIFALTSSRTGVPNKLAKRESCF